MGGGNKRINNADKQLKGQTKRPLFREAFWQLDLDISRNGYVLILFLLPKNPSDVIHLKQ